jgi:glycine cleavage system H protein
MTAQYPENLRYTDTHEYVQLDGQVATVGITSFAIDQLGDIVFLELPAVGTEVQKGERFGTIESVKAVEDLKAPLSGTVLECNQAMVDVPEDLANDPYSTCWLVKLQAANPAELDSAMSAKDYRSKVEGH